MLLVLNWLSPPAFVALFLPSLFHSLTLPVFLFADSKLKVFLPRQQHNPSFLSGDYCFLEIAKLAHYFPASSAATPLPPSPSPPSLLLLPLRSRPATSTIKQPETLCLCLTQTNADTLTFSQLEEILDWCDENKNFIRSESKNSEKNLYHVRLDWNNPHKQFAAIQPHRH